LAANRDWSPAFAALKKKRVFFRRPALHARPEYFVEEKK